MAYIGRGTESISNVEVLDNLTFDGSASYTLQKSSVNFVPSSANNLLISISGVVQQGNFSVSGSTITFDTTVSGSDTCDWILHYGTGLITTVADGAITEAKLGSNAVTTAKLAGGLTVTHAVGSAGSPSITFDSDSNTGIFSPSADTLAFTEGGTEAMRIDSSGNLLVGKTSSGVDTSGFEVASNGRGSFCRSGNLALYLVRNTSNGDIVDFRKDGTTVGSISVWNDHIGIVQGNTRLEIDDGSNAIFFTNNTTGGLRDNTTDLGKSNARLDDIFATNGTIQTSDQNEKQSIQSLSASEIAVAQRISKLFKTFKFNSSVEEKGDSARTHTGIIAQDVQQAFADEGLDASNYALFISSTWWEKEISVDAVAEELDEEGNVLVEGKDAYTYIDTKEEATEGYTERTRLGIRYPELLSFVSSAFEQRITNIETRLETLENK
jgi:hypothetical protein